MLGNTLGKRPKPRSFSYQPRFYDPEKEARQRRRISFTSQTRRGRQPSFIAVALLLLFAFYLYVTL